MANLPGPHEMEFKIRVDGFSHKLRVNCRVEGNPTPGTDFAAILLSNKAGSTQTAAISMNGFWNFIRAWYHTSVQCEEVNLWKYMTGTTSKTFLSTSVPTTPAGSSATAYGAARQTTLTFRTANGGICKNVFIEPSISSDSIGNLVANASGSVAEKIAAYWLSSASWMLGRDDSFVIAPLRVANTQNEAMYRKRFRLNL